MPVLAPTAMRRAICVVASPLPPAQVSAAWAGVASPRSGWDTVGLLEAARGCGG